MLSRAYGLEAKDADTYGSFADASTVSEWAREGMSALMEKGSLGGYADNTIRPHANLKRGRDGEATRWA